MQERDPLYPETVLGGRRGGRLGASLRFLGNALRERPLPRRILGAFSIVLIVGGAALMAYPIATDLYAEWRQSGLERQLGDPSTRTAYLERTIRPGDALTRIKIPRLGVDAVVVEGISLAALRAGAGHYPATALPCEEGNTAIAGHRTTYSEPFGELHRLRVGDRIVLETPIGRCHYEVSRDPWVTTPYDTSVLEIRRGSALTLTTCDPPGSAASRLIVRARLVQTELG